MIVVVVGRTGSGKTTVARELQKLTKWKIVEVSPLVERIAKTSKKSGRCTLLDEHKKHQSDPDWLWRLLAKEIVVGQSYIISGLREPYLYWRLTQLYHNVVLYALDATDLSRYCRLCAKEGYIPIEKFNEFENGADLLGLPILLDNAHYRINAMQSLEDIQKELTKFIISNNKK